MKVTFSPSYYILHSLCDFSWKFQGHANDTGMLQGLFKAIIHHAPFHYFTTKVDWIRKECILTEFNKNSFGWVLYYVIKVLSYKNLYGFRVPVLRNVLAKQMSLRIEKGTGWIPFSFRKAFCLFLSVLSLMKHRNYAILCDQTNPSVDQIRPCDASIKIQN